MPDFAELERLADIAREGTDPRIVANIPDESERRENRTVPTPPVLVSQDGEPAFVYTRGRHFVVPEGRLEFVMSCRGNGLVDMSFLVTQLQGDPWDGLDAQEDYELHVRAYGQDGTHVVPVRVVETYPSHQLVARVAGSAPADAPIFQWMGPTTNLSYQLRRDGQVMRDNGEFVSLTGGIDLSTFRKDVGPLLERCRDSVGTPEEPRPAAVATGPAPVATPDRAQADADPYVRALENCLVLPRRECILDLAARAGPSTDTGPGRSDVEGYLAAYRGDADAVVEALLERYEDEPDAAHNVAGSILAEVGLVDEALAILSRIETPFPARPGNIQSPLRRRFETAHLHVAEWMVARGAPIRQVIRPLQNRFFTLDESGRPVGAADVSKLKLLEILMRDPEAPPMIEMFAYLEGGNEATRGRAWAFRFVRGQNAVTATQRSVAEAIKAADPPQYGELYAREMMASRMASAGNTLRAYHLVRDVPSTFRSGADVHIHVLSGMGGLFASHDGELTSPIVRWAIDRATQRAGSVTSLAAAWATIAGALRDVGQVDAAEQMMATSEGMIRTGAAYPGRAGLFSGKSADIHAYIRALGASGLEGRALRFVHDIPHLDRRAALVELLRGMSLRERTRPAPLTRRP